MDYKPLLGMVIENQYFNYKFFQTLKSISQTWSQRKAAAKLGISHAVLNRRIIHAEEKLGFRLVQRSGAGSELTEKSIKILERYDLYQNRLEDRENLTISGGHISSGLVEALADEYGLKAAIYGSDDASSFYLAQKDFLDLLVLDDPLIAFQRDLDFTPIAFDHLVLISSSEEDIGSLDELIDSKFVSVAGSSQRLAWRTLQSKEIPFNIIREVKSPYEAFKIVKNNQGLYTFLNASFFTGSDILKEETQHAISLVRFGEFNPVIEEFIQFIFGPGQKIVKKQGFKPL
ncbi:helix-turn-helix domain-containing protein [Methanobacterium alcaliphilum]|uniref:helix-turn-helix domain-containing protein n=1 Tax=Methanobacterium alcaliphilum TaxID=392018 RepID=UPI00200A2E03|nr:LysR family transcriptional regulator [Methanobacterium alcaliphilum]MCK9151989.1 LysR family transcriptional regulator [Methanobacterium alcaliphilum]